MVRRPRLELGGAGVDRLVDGVDAEPSAQGANPDLAGEFRSQRGDLTIGQAAVLGRAQQLLVEHRCAAELGPQVDETGDLVDEPRVDARGCGDVLDAAAQA